MEAVLVEAWLSISAPFLSASLSTSVPLLLCLSEDKLVEGIQSEAA